MREALVVVNFCLFFLFSAWNKYSVLVLRLSVEMDNILDLLICIVYFFINLKLLSNVMIHFFCFTLDISIVLIRI